MTTINQPAKMFQSLKRNMLSFKICLGRFDRSFDNVRVVGGAFGWEFERPKNEGKPQRKRSKPEIKEGLQFVKTEKNNEGGK